MGFTGSDGRGAPCAGTTRTTLARPSPPRPSSTLRYCLTEEDSEGVTRPGKLRRPLSPSGDLTQKQGECGKTALRYKARRTRAHEPGGSCVGQSTGRPDKVRRVAAEGQQRKASSSPVPQPLSMAGGARAVGHTSGTSQARGRDGDGFQITLMETAQVTRQRPTDKLSPEDHSGCDYGRVAPGEAAAVGLPREKCLGRCYDEDKRQQSLETDSGHKEPCASASRAPRRYTCKAAAGRGWAEASARWQPVRLVPQGVRAGVAL